MLQYTNGQRRAITGASLAQLRRRLSASARACLAADLVDGRVILKGLTAKAIAGLCDVNIGYVDRALRLTPEQRSEVRRGVRPLVQPRTRKREPVVDWGAVDDGVIVEAIRRIGLERTLDAAVEVEASAAV